MMNKRNIGSTLDSLFEETGELDEINERVSKRLFAEQLRQAMSRHKVTSAEMARRMGTSRTAVNRLLDPALPGATLNSMVRASSVLDMDLRVLLVARRPAKRGRTNVRNGEASKPAVTRRRGQARVVGLR